MSSKFFKFKPLLKCVAVSVLTGLVSKYFFLNTSAITIFSGLIAFCITTVLYIYFKQVLVLSKLETLHQGIMSYEKQINERIHSLTNNIPTKHEFDHLEQNLQNFRVKSTTSKAAQSLTSSTYYSDNTTSSDDSSDDTSNDNKVVKLHPKKKKKSQGNALLAQLDMSDERAVSETLIEGLKIQLQPAISLDNKEIYSFDALPCLTDEDDGFVNYFDLKSTFSDENQQRIINQITLDQTINLVRRLRRQKKSPLVFVELLACTLNSKKAYDEFVGALKAHHQVKKNVIVEIPQFDFLTLTKAGLAKLRLILDLGFTLSMSNCTDIVAAVSAIKKGLFSHVKLTIDTIEGLSIDEKSAKELEIVSLCRDAKINIIVTGVEKDYQVIQLIDNHVAIAEGNFFSTPKFPSQDSNDKAAAVKK